MTGALVGPLAPVAFSGGPGFGRTIRYFPPLPVNTLDPRVLTCFDHHLACDCREAELAENVTEHRIEWQDHKRHEGAVLAVALLHRPDTRDRGSARYCLACQTPWPCATRNLVAHLVPDYAMPQETP